MDGGFEEFLATQFYEDGKTALRDDDWEFYAEEIAIYKKAWDGAISSRKSKTPKVRLNCHLPKLPDEVEVELFISEDDLHRMRPVNGGFMVRIIAINEKSNVNRDEASHEK